MPGRLERTFDALQGSGSFHDDAKAEAPSKPLKSRKASGYIPEAEFISFLRGDEVAASKSDIFVGKGILASLLIALFGGLALNLTPCVLPMIPINLA
jgi:thiol:disulfide interchange protein